MTNAHRPKTLSRALLQGNARVRRNLAGPIKRIDSKIFQVTMGRTMHIITAFDISTVLSRHCAGLLLRKNSPHPERKCKYLCIQYENQTVFTFPYGVPMCVVERMWWHIPGMYTGKDSLHMFGCYFLTRVVCGFGLLIRC